jgi:hypothetical protein
MDAAKLRESADRLFEAQHPRLGRRNGETPIRGPNEVIIGEVPVRPGEISVISLVGPTRERRHSLISIRNWIVGPNPGERHPTKFGFSVPGDAAPKFAAFFADAMDKLAAATNVEDHGAVWRR